MERVVRSKQGRKRAILSKIPQVVKKVQRRRS